MQTKQKKSLSVFIVSMLSASIFWCLTSCFTTDTYHNKKHIDTIKKDLVAAHQDLDRALGVDKPSPVMEKQ
jgi:hypothetical protein